MFNIIKAYHRFMKAASIQIIYFQLDEAHGEIRVMFFKMLLQFSRCGKSHVAEVTLIVKVFFIAKVEELW